VEAERGESVVDIDAGDLGVVGEDDDRAELADAACPRENRPRQDTAAGKRESHPPEGAPAGVAERPGHALQLRVYAPKGLPGPAHQNRRRHEQHGYHDPGDMAHELEPDVRQRTADLGPATQEQQKGDAGHGVWYHHGKVDEALNNPPAGEGPARQQIGQRHAE
jgi:hypothetical protein